MKENIFIKRPMAALAISILMRPAEGEHNLKSFNGRIRAAYNASYTAILNRYKRGVMLCHPSPLASMEFVGCCRHRIGCVDEYY